MARENLTRYLWIIDTIRSYGSISREEMSRLWERSALSNGRPMARRTFYNDRASIESIFGINIQCDSATYEYYIESSNEHQTNAMNWLLNSASIGNVISGTQEIGHKIFLEEAPSSHENLPIIVEALKQNSPVTFTYQSYSRINPSRDNQLEPYFLKFFKQRWYITGRNVKSNTLRTYALERMTEITMVNSTFIVPEEFNAEDYIRHSYGIIFDEGSVKNVAVRTDSRQAKYLRSVPLHHSQRETLHDSYSVFYYQLKITPDFVQELLSYGPKITVLNPPELRAMIVTSLKESLNNYGEFPETKEARNQ